MASHAINFNITDSQMAALSVFAAAEGVSVSGAGKLAMLRYLGLPASKAGMHALNAHQELRREVMRAAREASGPLLAELRALLKEKGHE